jgi:undecaprenyl phosphate-alpha-L-ara4N flippase subunit ArnF
MKVVILAGGLGTRLSEETEIKPKPLVDAGNMHYIYILVRQIILKWRIKKLNWTMIESSLLEKVKCYLALFFEPYILSGLFAAFIASVFWTIAMSKFELTIVGLFTWISHPIVFLLGFYFLDKTFTTRCISNCRLFGLDSFDRTVKDYLTELSKTIWPHGQRPFDCTAKDHLTIRSNVYSPKKQQFEMRPLRQKTIGFGVYYYWDNYYS